MTWGRTLKKVLESVKIPTDFGQWRTAAADRDQWRAICGSKSRTKKEIAESLPLRHLGGTPLRGRTAPLVSTTTYQELGSNNPADVAKYWRLSILKLL